MEKSKNYLSQFNIIVWVLLIGTVFARGSSFMTLPFLAIYLSRMDLHPFLIGLAIGVSPFMAIVGGFIGGHLSDRFGRKPIILIALFSIAFVYFGFSIADSPSWFIILNALNGFCNSFFEPTSQALIADLTNQENRMKAYSLRYTAINIGGALGPVLGAYLASTSSNMTFIMTGSTYLIYGIVMLILMRGFTSSDKQQQVQVKNTFYEAFTIVKRDKAFRYLILGIILVNIGYSQMDSNLPQHIEVSLENGIFLYSVLLSINAILVVLLQLPITHYVEKFKPMNVMIFGSITLSAGLIGFSFVNGWVTSIIAMTLFTIGEILIFPSNSLLIDQLAGEQLRGIYFGASQFRKIGNFVGPIIGGILLDHTGGQQMFLIITIMTLGSIFFFTLWSRIPSKNIN